LTEENSKLQELIQKEQNEKVTQLKDTMELEIRIKTFEDEVIKSKENVFILFISRKY